VRTFSLKPVQAMVWASAVVEMSGRRRTASSRVSVQFLGEPLTASRARAELHVDPAAAPACLAAIPEVQSARQLAHTAAPRTRCSPRRPTPPARSAPTRTYAGPCSARSTPQCTTSTSQSASAMPEPRSTWPQQIDLAAITVTERMASLLIDVVQAFFQWGRYEQVFTTLHAAEQTAPDEITARASGPHPGRAARQRIPPWPFSVAPWPAADLDLCMQREANPIGSPFGSHASFQDRNNTLNSTNSGRRWVRTTGPSLVRRVLYH
jgi:hypothetical protein